jgi:PKD repeat protein
MPRRSPFRSALVALMTVGMLAAFAAPAVAAPATRTVTTPLVGNAPPISLFDTGLQVCDNCVPDILVSNFDEAGAGAQLSADIKTHWTSDAHTDVAYDDSNLRQGSTLPTSDNFKSSNGTITATFGLDAFIGLVVKNNGDANWQKTTTSVSPHVDHAVTIPCDLPPVGGPPRVCDSGSDSFNVASFPVLPGLVSIDLNLTFDIQVTVDGNGVATLRQATVTSGDGISPDHNFTFSPTNDTQPDSMALACTQPAGSDLQYSFNNTSFSGNVDYAVNLGLDIVANITDPFPNFTLHVPIASVDLGNAPITLTAPDASADLGPVLPDLDPPTADPGNSGAYSGTEGFAVSFDGSASSDPHCGPPTLSWNFGDGSAPESGTNPSHIFSEEGTYNGTLTATNGAGLQSSTPFTVTVADAPLIATGRTIVAPNPVSATVATFVDTDPTNTLGDSNQDPSDYTATISWGDGTTTPGTIVPNGTGFDINGTHTYSAADLGPQTLQIHVCDVGGACADATSHLTVFSFLGQGSFVLGDNSASGAVTFWGAQWAKTNSFSGGGAPSSFKGFADATNPAPPTCGGTWSGGPGNSSNYGGSLPSFMGVVVTSAASKHGPTTSGNVTHIVVVQTGGGTVSNPGHAGTGTVVATFC